MPEDPRDVVEVEFGGRLYRLIGGSVERPIADLERLNAIAEAADPYLESKLGFGLRHFAEVALTHLDAVLAEASPVSHPGHDIGDSSVSFVQSEVCPEPPDRQWTGPHAAALEWATTDVASIEYHPGSPVSAFGTTLRVRFPDELEPRWLPVMTIPEALASAASRLAEMAASEDWRVRRRFVQLAAERVRRRLWRFSPVVIGPPDLDDGPDVSPDNVAQWAIQYGARTVLAVQLSDFLGEPSIDGMPAVVEAANEVAASGAPVKLPFASGSLALQPGVRVIPVIVHAGAGHLVTFGPPGALRLSIEDLDWIASSAQDESDLLHFAEEMSRTNLPAMFGLETINIWQWWLENGGAIFRGGKTPSTVAFQLHRGTEEWERAKRLTPLERSLHALSLPPVREWDVVDDSGPGPINLLGWGQRGEAPSTYTRGSHSRPTNKVVAVHVSAVPVAFEVPAQDEVQQPVLDAVFDLAGAFGFALETIDDEWVRVAGAAGCAALRVELRVVDQAAAPFHVEITDRADHVIFTRLDVDFDLLGDQADGDANAGRSLMASVFGDLASLIGADAQIRRELVAAWLAAPPTLTVNLSNSPFSRNHLRSPIALESPLEAEVDRQLGSALQAAGVTPGRYAPEAAKELDRDVLAPVALDLLNDRLAPFASDDLVHMGMIQLERILTRRELLLQEVRNSYGTLNLSWDPVERQREIEAEYLKLRRCAELIVEAALLFQPKGALPLDDRSWAELMAASAAYLEATTRSEGLHYQIIRSGLEIGPLFDLSLEDWEPAPGAPVTVDLASFQTELAQENLGRTILDAEDTPALEGLLAVADDLLRDLEGSTIRDVTVALAGLVTWKLTDADFDAVRATEQDIVSRLLETTVAREWDDGGARMLAALKMLRSDPSSYARHDWSPWRLRSRRERLLVRPLPTMGNGELLVAPRFCRAALHVYQGYWGSGQLPWSQTRSSQLEKALEAIRSHRNLELERQIADLLEGAGWVSVSRIKPGDGKRIGVAALTTEVDIVAGKADRNVIWVLEVKDPAPVYAPADIRRQLRRFHEEPRCYSNQLSRKLREVASDPGAVAAAPGLPAKDTYVVRSLFVTRRVAPAAFASSPHPFTTAAHLLSALDA